MHRRKALLAAGLFLIATYIWPAAGQTPRPAGATVFEGARLITGDGSAPIEDAAFVVGNSRITAVGRRGEVAAPAGAAALRSHRQARDPADRGCPRPPRIPPPPPRP